MKAHIIENGVVVNTIVVESLDLLPNLIDAELGGSIGDLYDGTTFTKPAPVVIEPTPAPTKEQLMAELTALTAKIQALE
jgi:hypothetical protein